MSLPQTPSFQQIQLNLNGKLSSQTRPSQLFITAFLDDKKYTIIQSTSDSTRSIISENKNNNIAQISLGAMMHISPRQTDNFKLGFTFGFGLNSNDISNAKVFVGGSAIFGAQDRFIISTGVSLAKIDYLKSEYELDTEIETSSIDNEVTEKTLRPGWFIGFTYNLTNKKKE